MLCLGYSSLLQISLQQLITNEVLKQFYSFVLLQAVDYRDFQAEVEYCGCRFQDMACSLDRA